MVLGWFGNLFSPILNPLLSLDPISILLIVSFGVAIIFTLVYKFATDQKMIKAIREEMKTLQKEMKKFRDKPETFAEMQKTVMQKNMLVFKQTMKANLITMIPILVIFGALKGVYAETSLGGAWIWYYIGAAIISSIVFRKLFKLP